MRFAPSIVVLLLMLGSSGSQSSESDRITEALTLLDRAPSGKKLLTQAMRHWGFAQTADLRQRFRWGEVSRTDAVLTRHYHPETGEESRERQVTIFLRRDQRFEDLVLDVAHELTHAIATPAWDPYDPLLTAGRYIHASIEGPGGEVEALSTECRIGLELEKTRGFEVPRCRRYREAKNGEPSREKIVEDFYRVGRWRKTLEKALGKEVRAFRYLSEDAPQLLSSTGRAPYPIALLREFEALNEVACENTRRRVTLAQSASTEGRSPASVPAEPIEGAEILLKRRCGSR